VNCLAPERVDAPASGGRYRSLIPDLPPRFFGPLPGRDGSFSLAHVLAPA